MTPRTSGGRHLPLCLVLGRRVLVRHQTAQQHSLLRPSSSVPIILMPRVQAISTKDLPWLQGERRPRRALATSVAYLQHTPNSCLYTALNHKDCLVLASKYVCPSRLCRSRYLGVRASFLQGPFHLLSVSRPALQPQRSSAARSSQHIGCWHILSKPCLKAATSSSVS